jgi:hypothetical protein
VEVVTEVSSVDVTPGSGTFSSIGESVQLTAVAYDAGGNQVAGKTFVWETSNGAVASVYSTGVTVAAGNGIAEITATTEGVSGSADVVVAQVPRRAAVRPTSAVIPALGATVDLDVVTFDANGHEVAGDTTSSTWTSLNDDVATVDGVGVVSASRDGQVSIKAEALGSTMYSLVTVTVPNAQPVSSWDTVAGYLPHLRDLWGSSADDIWAVGNVFGGNGTILHFDGTQWSEVSIPRSDYLYGVWGSAADDVWAVGRSKILHFDGTDWTEATSFFGGGGGDLFDVWGSAPDDVWAVGWGSGGWIVHYDGNEWTTYPRPDTRPLKGVWGSGPEDVWAVGWDGFIIQFDGSQWRRKPSTTALNLEAIWGSGPNAVWAVGADCCPEGVVLHFGGTRWEQAVVPVDTSDLYGDITFPFTDVWGTGPGEVYAVGDEDEGGKIDRFDGVAWTRDFHLMELGDMWPEAVWGTSTSEVWVVGSEGIVCGTRN